MSADLWQSILSQVLLFTLLCGMAASVDTTQLKNSFRKWKGIVIGLFCQFIVMPALGFACTKAYGLKPAYGIALLATTASPGGAYSNWWCSLLNADLALSVAMTTCSTAACIIFMPLNLLLYVHLSFDESPQIEWWKLILNISVAMVAIISGTAVSHFLPAVRDAANCVGNLAGLALIIFGLVIANSDEPIWSREAIFYPSIASPLVAGIIVSFALAICSRSLLKPEMLSVTVETGYQNTGLALSIALATFSGENKGDASSVPIYYAAVQVAVLPVFLLIAWKAGFSHAPSNAPFWRVLWKSWQPNERPGFRSERSVTLGAICESSLEDRTVRPGRFSSGGPSSVHLSDGRLIEA
eukprot:CAMPEP_0194514416 /NCGR_PEP_ID=MMETSP0253-20130528/46872_1 /TAXON_ID=2966 /ORGANISM="Noctiluca scintillans" /LENGTH=354 /DNA_ID=CAMNT_0039358075 /DNA_START=34 /DNA_END=1098 /DNA_ORIENTATION=-